MIQQSVRQSLEGWIDKPGAYVSVDGQYGSTGKGVINGILGELFWRKVENVITNAGPNSGHTNYYAGEQIVLKQLPTFGVTAALVKRNDMTAGHSFPRPKMLLSAGAVVDVALLDEEIEKWGVGPVWVHPNAAVIDGTCRALDQQNVKNVASTGQGVGPALIRKMQRVPHAVFGHDAVRTCLQHRYDHETVSFVEVSQGFSLGINSGFYPHVTTRECTVSQALADAQISPRHFRGCVMSVRTYPIRVGNTENSSGPCYPDQKEISWEELGQTPELTTVTKRVRRVFTWSREQFMDAVAANTPDVLFVNFANYIKDRDVVSWLGDNVLSPYERVMRKRPRAVLVGYGPRPENVHAFI